ncbi:Holin-like protein CidB [Candida viswanathii]|uniref:Holin-like protein CidB n=1 Tax=Candida viswanathii TaxID=5486 RepID=A0A367XN48_9ASCO|nr:Holin-like protein CidB [Candida viswanathii]
MRDDITTIDIDSLQPINTNNREVTPPRSVTENPFDDTSSNLPEPEPIYHKPHHVDTYPRTQATPVQEQDSVSVEQREEVQLSPITVFITNNMDWLLYGLLFIVSLPLYFTPLHIYLFYHLSITVLAFFVAELIRRKIPLAHSIITSTGIILFVCFIGSLIYHRHPKGFLDDLKFYRTGKNYLLLFSGETLNNNGKSDTVPEDNPTATPQWPGCGDFLSSLMDISIVSLSLPMFTHRRDFVKNFAVLCPTILLSIGLTFFLYPIVCHAIGIEAERSIGFIGRSVTLALGTPLILALGGSVSLMAVCTILSGILGVLINEPLFRILRVDKNDFVTRGVTLGINCGAIATAHLLNVDPRAASMSSLSFSVFGTVMVIMASVNAVREVVRSWVGL